MRQKASRVCLIVGVVWSTLDRDTNPKSEGEEITRRRKEREENTDRMTGWGMDKTYWCIWPKREKDLTSLLHPYTFREIAIGGGLLFVPLYPFFFTWLALGAPVFRSSSPKATDKDELQE